jgi:hypothetical protein
VPKYVAVTIIKPIFHYCGVFFCGRYTSIAPERDQNYVKNFEMWCWRRMVEIIHTSRVRNVKVLHRVKEEGISYVRYKEGKQTSLVISCVGTAF